MWYTTGCRFMAYSIILNRFLVARRREHCSGLNDDREETSKNMCFEIALVIGHPMNLFLYLVRSE